jgi:aspartate kinase
LRGESMIVMKFGGTSLANAERIKNVASIVERRLDKKPIVVVSAVGGITDKLINVAKEASKGINPTEKANEIINIHKEIIKSLNLDDGFIEDDFINLYDSLNGIYLLKELSLRSMDLISSFGEILSSKILSKYLNSLGLNSEQYCGWEIGIITNDNFSNAEILEETYNNIKNNLSSIEKIPIVTGFIAKDEEGNITTLGRGGSDYTASIIGSALNVEEIEIWTDVDGIKTADPRIVPSAIQWKIITFNEASEMAYFGAKILHPKTIKPAVNKQIPVRILNTYNLENKGTMILKEDEENHLFKSISSKNNITVIRICSTDMLLAHGFLAKIFETFNRYKISIDLISTSEVTVSVTLDNINNSLKNLDFTILELKEIGKVEILKDMSIICVVGEGIRNKPGILGRMFNVCKNLDTNIEMVSQGASPLSISFVVNQNDSDNVIKELHKELFEK